MIRRFPNGETHLHHFSRLLSDQQVSEVDKVSQIEYIDLVKRTRGTETSQYLEEKTSTEIPLVVASERGPGQCLIFN